MLEQPQFMPIIQSADWSGKDVCVTSCVNFDFEMPSNMPVIVSYGIVSELNNSYLTKDYFHEKKWSLEEVHHAALTNWEKAYSDLEWISMGLDTEIEFFLLYLDELTSSAILSSKIMKKAEKFYQDDSELSFVALPNRNSVVITKDVITLRTVAEGMYKDATRDYLNPPLSPEVVLCKDGQIVGHIQLKDKKDRKPLTEAEAGRIVMETDDKIDYHIPSGMIVVQGEERVYILPVYIPRLNMAAKMITGILDFHLENLRRADYDGRILFSFHDGEPVGDSPETRMFLDPIFRQLNLHTQEKGITTKEGKTVCLEYEFSKMDLSFDGLGLDKCDEKENPDVETEEPPDFTDAFALIPEDEKVAMKDMLYKVWEARDQILDNEAFMYTSLVDAKYGERIAVGLTEAIGFIYLTNPNCEQDDFAEKVLEEFYSLLINPPEGKNEINQFVYNVLPCLVFEEQDRLKEILRERELASGFIKFTWMSTGGIFPEKTEIDVHSVANGFITLVTLPQPKKRFDPAFVAIVMYGNFNCKYCVLAYETDNNNSVISQIMKDGYRIRTKKCNGYDSDMFLAEIKKLCGIMEELPANYEEYLKWLENIHWFAHIPQELEIKFREGVKRAYKEGIHPACGLAIAKIDAKNWLDPEVYRKVLEDIAAGSYGLFAPDNIEVVSLLQGFRLQLTKGDRNYEEEVGNKDIYKFLYIPMLIKEFLYEQNSKVNIYCFIDQNFVVYFIPVSDAVEVFPCAWIPHDQDYPLIDLEDERNQIEYLVRAYHLSSLQRAAMRGDSDEVKKFIAQGADLSVNDVRGYSLLHLAASYGKNEVIKVLVDAGCDVNIENNDGEMPRQIAKNNKFPDTEMLLLELSI